MTGFATIITLIALCLFSWLLSHGVRFYALRTDMVDVPGKRSSHTVVTPRGGGLAIVVVATLAALCQWYLQLASTEWLLAIYLPAGLLGLFSFVDDHQSLPRDSAFLLISRVRHSCCTCCLRVFLFPSLVFSCR